MHLKGMLMESSMKYRYSTIIYFKHIYFGNITVFLLKIIYTWLNGIAQD